MWPVAILAVVTVAFLAVASVASADSSLVGEWHMDNVQVGNRTPDSSGAGNSLQIASQTQTTGRWGQAFSFDPSTHDGLTTTNSAAFQTPNVTVMAWVKAASSPGQYRAIVTQGGDSGCGVASYALYTDTNGGLSFYIATNSTTAIKSPNVAPASIWDGNWHAIAGVYDGSAVRLYVDGSQVGTGTPESGAIDYALSDSVFEVGNFHVCQGSSTFGFHGAIDEVRVYNRALSGSEIAELQSPTATSPPELGVDPTVTSVNCTPGTIVLGAGTGATCTATVADSAPAPSGAPAGTVSFMSDQPGSFSGATCTLTASGAETSTCSVTYTPSAVGSGLHTITAAYTSSGSDGASQGTAQIGVSVTPTTTPSPTPAAAPPVSTFTVPPLTILHDTVQTTLAPTSTAGATEMMWSVNGTPTATCPAQAPDLSLSLIHAATVTLTALGPGGSSSTSHVVAASGNGLLQGKSAQVFTGTSVCGGDYSLLTPLAASTPNGTVDTTAGGGPPAGCNTTITAGIIAAVGCFEQVTDPSGVPTPEAAILTALSTDDSGTLKALAGYVCQNIANCRSLLGGVTIVNGRPQYVAYQAAPLYVSHLPVRIDGVDFKPLPGGSIVISPAFGRIVSADALVTVKGVPIQLPGPVNLDIGLHCVVNGSSCQDQPDPVASFDSSQLPGVGDFPLTGQADLSFVASGTEPYSEINGHVQLPSDLGGITVDAQLKADNTDGLSLQNFHVHLDSIGFDDIGLTNVDVYFQTPGDWAFYGTLGLGPTVQIDLHPDADHPLDGIVFHNGSLDHAGVTVNLQDSPPQIAPGVFLNTLDGSFAANPSVIRGAVTLTALQVAEVTGNFVIAFPSQADPFHPTASDLPGAPASVLNNPGYTQSPVIGAGGKVNLVIPQVGEVPIGASGAGYFLYAPPSYIAAGGQITYNFLGVASIDGQMQGEINFANKHFNLEGGVQGCIEDLGCASATAALSDLGIGVCLGDWGGGFLWSDFPVPHIYLSVLGIGKKCLASRFEDDNVFADARAARAAAHLPHAALAPVTVTVTKRNPIPGIELDGSSGAVNVSVSGPHGTLVAQAPGVHRGSGMLVLQSNTLRETVVSFEGGPGKYTITPLPGPTIIRSLHALPVKPMTVTGHVTGTGTARALHYATTHQPGERITFIERAHGAEHEIGTVSRARGTLHFSAPAGGDPRTILADVAMNGVPVPAEQNITVARFTAPRYVVPGRSARVTAHWRGSALEIGWRAAAHAARYAVTLVEHRGVKLHFLTRARSLKLTDARPWRAGTVTVIAVSSDGSRGIATTARYAAARKAPDKFLPFSELKAKPNKTKPKKKAKRPKG